MIPVHVAVEKNIRNAVEEKSKWRIFQLGKFFAAVLIEETKDSYMAYTKRKINPAYLDKTMSGAILKQMGKIKREEMINDRKIILKEFGILVRHGSPKNGHWEVADCGEKNNEDTE